MEKNKQEQVSGGAGLTSTSAGARQYFSGLPQDVQEMIIARREQVKSADLPEQGSGGTPRH
ncbi:MAG: hypothetical protein FWE32_10950 [Oscillospiraceae bacterium]|nr:hypothetical protein [Oscillospiraceae bacterium]